jgi:catechol 2,3-dioxygenase-like lactoylglutathione lyase family enzyme
MQIEFVSSFAPITTDPAASRALYVEALGLPLESSDGDGYIHSDQIPGSRHFGVWPLAEAAEACFGTTSWPPDTAVPQACVEFELSSPDAVQAGADELEGRGYSLLHGARLEPWGQTVARLLSPEHLVVGLSYAPWMHDQAQA